MKKQEHFLQNEKNLTLFLSMTELTKNVFKTITQSHYFTVTVKLLENYSLITCA